MKKNMLPDQIEKTMQSLDVVQRAKAPEGFYEKLQKRMVFTKSRMNPFWIKMLNIGAAAMIVLTLLDGYFIFNNQSETNPVYKDFAEQYLESSSSFLDD